MPTVSVYKEELFESIGVVYTDEEFDQLCFDFGIELDDITSDAEIVQKEQGAEAAKGLSEAVVYKIDVPANRYDVLCIEGIARALRIFLQKEKVPAYTKVQPLPANKNQMVIVQKKETLGIRAYCCAAVLRGVNFTEARYRSFMDLQDKLHQNIGRRRTLCSIGTHDLDTVEGPFTYEALPKKDIKFKPLFEEKEFNVEELFHYYKNEKPNCHLKPFLHITEDHPVHPVLRDAKGRVLSLPPIINGEHSKITLNTKNVLIECTGTDYTKLRITLNTMVSMFSEHCDKPYHVEMVNVIRPDGSQEQFPDLKECVFEASVDYINRGIGIKLAPDAMAKILDKMALPAVYLKGKRCLQVTAPCTRSDILHACDVLEDVAIAYGYNNIKRTIPACTTVGKEQPLNKLGDLLREVIAQAGYLEVLTWVLTDYRENFEYLNREDDGTTCVTLSNPTTEEFNVVRTTLLPGLLKTLCSNKGRVHLPIRIFELSDVVLQDPARDVGARNNRRAAALFCGTTSGFEHIHGLLDRIMGQNNCTFVPANAEHKEESSGLTYTIKPSSNPTFFPGRCADVLLNGKTVIGTFGIVHPKVLENFEIPYPCSALEVDIEAFL